MKTLILLLLAALVLGQNNLQIVCPAYLEINDMEFTQKLRCTDDQNSNIECEANGVSLPQWLKIQNNQLKIVSKPQQDENAPIVINAIDQFGNFASKIVILQIQIYYYQRLTQTNTVDVSESSQETVKESTTTDGNTVTERKQITTKIVNNKNQVNETKSEKTLIINTVVNNGGNGSPIPTIIENKQNTENQQTKKNTQSKNSKQNQTKSQKSTEVKKTQTNEDKQAQRYVELLNRQARAHELVSYYLVFYSKIKEGMNSLNQNKKKYQDQKDKYNDKKDKLLEELKDCQAKINDLLKKIQDFQKELKSIDLKLTAKLKELRSLEKKVANLEKELKNLNQKLKNINDEIHKAEKQLKQYQEKLQDHKKKCLIIKQEILKTQKLLKQLLEAKEWSRKKIQELQRESQAYAQEIEELKKRIRELESKKKATDRAIVDEKKNNLKIHAQISQARLKLQALKKECDGTIVAELQGKIRDLINKIRKLESEKNKVIAQIEKCKDLLSKARKDLTACQNEINRLKQLKSSIENEIKKLKKAIEEKRAKIAKINHEIEKINKKLKQIDEVLARLEKESAAQHKQKKEIVNKLKDALTQKMIVDGLIKKEVLNEHQIIQRLGFEDIFQRQSNLPENSMFEELQTIQNKILESDKLYEVKRDHNLKNGDECPADSSSYGVGKITGKRNGKIQVEESDGTKVQVSMASCSTNLSSQENYSPKVGDLICWRGVKESHVFIVVESLIFSH